MKKMALIGGLFILSFFLFFSHLAKENRIRSKMRTAKQELEYIHGVSIKEVKMKEVNEEIVGGCGNKKGEVWFNRNSNLIESADLSQWKKIIAHQVKNCAKK
jgi:hypothetical protein